MNKKTPKDYGLPHSEWRLGQQESFERVYNALIETDKRVTIIQAPTGSGKTNYPASLPNSGCSVMALCRTKLLQIDNYKSFGFDVLFGKGNYRCGADNKFNCSECTYVSAPSDCPYYHQCEYYTTRRKVQASNKISLNYPYYLLSQWTKGYSDYLFLDEAHLLSEITLDFAGITILQKDIERYKLPDIPQIKPNSGGSGYFSGSDLNKAQEWLRLVLNKAIDHQNTLNKTSKLNGTRRVEATKKLGEITLFCKKIKYTLDCIEQSEKDWFVMSGKKIHSYRGKFVDVFIAKPLTAKWHFPGLFMQGESKLVLMSATIGDVVTYSGELGIPPTIRQFVDIPSQIDPKRRPIFIPKDSPKIGRKAEDIDYDKQADIIANLIKSVNPEWSGVIHVSSKVQSKELASRLAQRDLASRIWLPPNAGTDKQIQAWQRQNHTGKLAITYSWHEGVDLVDEKICIVAKILFPPLSDEYERARMYNNGKFYLQRACWQVQQACGRTRRGNEFDYDTDDEMRGLAAIVDGNWKRLRNYMSADFKKSIVEI